MGSCGYILSASLLGQGNGWWRVTMHRCCAALHSAQSTRASRGQTASRGPDTHSWGSNSCFPSSLEHSSCLRGQLRTVMGNIFLPVLPGVSLRADKAMILLSSVHTVMLSELVRKQFENYGFSSPLSVPSKEEWLVSSPFLWPLLCSPREFRFCFPPRFYSTKPHSLSLSSPILILKQESGFMS